MKCRYCGYDNEPLPGDEAPENCEGCGVSIEMANTGRPRSSKGSWMKEYL